MIFRIFLDFFHGIFLGKIGKKLIEESDQFLMKIFNELLINLSILHQFSDNARQREEAIP